MILKKRVLTLLLCLTVCFLLMGCQQQQKEVTLDSINCGKVLEIQPSSVKVQLGIFENNQFTQTAGTQEFSMMDENLKIIDAKGKSAKIHKGDIVEITLGSIGASEIKILQTEQ